MARLSKRSSERPRPVMNVTPLVDIVLVLLIIFMVVIPAMETGAEVALPAVLNVDEGEAPEDPFVLSLTADGQLFLDEDRIDADAIEPALRAASERGLPILIASSSEVYGKGVRCPFREDDDIVLGPTTVTRWSYAAGKAVDEFLALAHHRERGTRVVVARFFNTVGPRQVGRYGMVVPRFVEQALDGAAHGQHGGLQDVVRVDLFHACQRDRTAQRLGHDLVVEPVALLGVLEPLEHFRGAALVRPGWDDADQIIATAGVGIDVGLHIDTAAAGGLDQLCHLVHPPPELFVGNFQMDDVDAHPRSLADLDRLFDRLQHPRPFIADVG